MRIKYQVTKIVVCFFVSLLVIMPLAPVWASDSVSVSSETETVSSNEPIILPAVTQPISIKDNEGQSDSLSQALQGLDTIPDGGITEINANEPVPLDMYSTRDNAGAKPKVGSNYGIDDFSGTFSYTAPIEFPAGRQNLSPIFSLNYNHQRAAIGSVTGFGWELSLPSIERDSRSGTDKLYTDNYFKLNLGGSADLVPISVDGSGYGSYGKRIESDFNDVQYSASGWVVIDKLGTRYTFGRESVSKQTNPNDSTKVYKWMLSEIRDTNSNFVKYEYVKDGNQVYPKRIVYTGSGTTDGIYEIKFQPFATAFPGTATNVQSISYQTGFQVETRFLLTRIEVLTSGIVTRAYDISYENNVGGNKKLLTSITPKAYKDGVESSKDQTTFMYSIDTPAYTSTAQYHLPSGHVLGQVMGIAESKRDMFIDLNQDGFTDYIRLYCGNGTLNMNVFQNDTKGGWTGGPHSMSFGSGFPCNRYTSIPVAFAELNGDHKIDMITNTNSYLNTGAGWTLVSGGSPFSLSQSTGPGSTPQNAVNFVDLNNDGYDDILYESHPTNASTAVAGYIKTPGAGWNLDADYAVSVTMGMADCLGYGGSPMGYADLNHDGLQDIFYNYDCSFGSFSETAGGAYLNNGGGFAITTLFGPLAQMSYYNGNSSTPTQQVNLISDYDHNGIVDGAGYSRFKNVSAGGARQSGGTLSILGQTVINEFIAGTTAYFETTLPVAVADLNGDQAQDVIHSLNNASLNFDEVYLGSLEKPDILNKLDFQSGGSAEIHYGYSADERDGAGNVTNQQLPFSLFVAKEILVHDGLGNLTGTYYGYANGTSASYIQNFVQDVYGFGQVTKKTGSAVVNVDLGDGSDGAYVSIGNDHWSTNKEFTSLTIQNGHTVVVDPNVTIRVQGLARIDGILTAEGLGYGGGGWSNGNGGDGGGPGKGEMGANFGSTGYGGGGAGYATVGGDAPNVPNNFGDGGSAYGSYLLQPLELGSGGGAGHNGGSIDIGFGGSGGGIISLSADTILVNGEINADGINGEDGMHFTTYSGDIYTGGGGGGSGGSILIKAKNQASIGSNKVTATGGSGGFGLHGSVGNSNSGGNGSPGRIRIEALTINGTSNPTYYSAGNLELSVNNQPSDSNIQIVDSKYATAGNSGSTIDPSYYTHGRKLRERRLDSSDYIKSQTNYEWMTSTVGNRTFVGLDNQATTEGNILDTYALREHTFDSNTTALYHMNGAKGSSEKRSGIGVNSSYDLIEDVNVYAAESFNGRNDGAYRVPTLTPGNTFTLGSSWTIEFWFKALSLPTANRGFFRSTNISSSSRLINSALNGESGTHTLGIEIVNDGSPRPTVVTPFGIQPNRWYHLALVENGGSNLTLYIDGAQVDQNTTASQPELITQTFIFGEGNGGTVPTLIDEFRLSNTARSASAISSYYNSTLSPISLEGRGMEYTYDTANGNVLTEENLGKGQLEITTGSFTNISGDEKTTTYAYAQNSTKHILATPKTKTINSTSETKTQDFYYDQSTILGSVDKANLTKEDLKTNTVDIETTYNNYGLPLTKKDPKDNTAVSLTYDTNNLFVSTTTDALGRQTATKYDKTTGQLLSSRDPNGYQEKNTYDAFGRLIKKELSDPNSVTTLITKQVITYQDATFPNYTEVKDYFSAGNYTTSREYYDGLGRVIQTVKSADGGQFIVSYKQYDSQGRVAKESLPVFVGTINYNASPSFTLAKTYTYDALDRVLTEVTPTGMTSYAYDGLVTTITDPKGKLKKLTKDAHDNLVKVEEFNGGSPYITTYEYSLTNKLKKITDALGNIRTFTYDALDNLTQQDMVHKSSVSNPVKWTYTYDKNGNVLSKADPKYQTTNYTYDTLNRLVTENFTGKTGIEYALTYDQGSGQIGRLTSAVSNNGVTMNYTYDKQGKPLTVTRTIDGMSYVLTYTYDWNGNVASITYPEGERIDYLYNSVGQINQVNKVKNAQTTVLASNVTYSPLGQITHLERANGVTTDYTYDPAKIYRLTRILSFKGSTKLQDLGYSYDANGNILAMSDTSNTQLAKTTNYTYDDLNRLTSVAVTGAASGTNYSHSYTYDAIGNILTSEAGTYTYNNNNPHQANNIGGTAYIYDTNGNVKYIGQDFLRSDYRDRMDYSRQANSADYTEYLYDHTNQRVKKHTVAYVTPPGGGGCAHPDDCPDPEQGAPVMIQPTVEPIPGKLPMPIDESLEGESSMEQVVGEQTDDSIFTPEVSTQPTDSSLTPISVLHTPDSEVTIQILDNLDIEEPVIEPLVVEPLATSTEEIINPEPVVPIEPDQSLANDATATSTEEMLITPDSDITEAPITSVEEPQPDIAPVGSDIATYYIDKYYEKEFGGVARNHYFIGNVKLGSEVLSGANTGIFYSLSDHLGSSSLITNSTGSITEVADYKPYGSISYSNITQNIGDHYKFTGKELDSENGLSYFGARYYGQANGRFMAIDPVMFSLASDERTQQKTGAKQQQLLADPQSLNSYAYSRNNPVILVDPDGKWWKEVITGRQSFADFNVEIGQAAQQLYDTSKVWQKAMDHPVATGVATGVAGGATAAGATLALGGSVTCGIICGSTAATVVTTVAPVAPLASKVTNLSTKPIVRGALDKLEKVGDQINKSPQEILDKASSATIRLVDNANNQNINILISKNANNIRDGFIRVTLNPSAQRVISAGTMRFNQVWNGIIDGRFKPF